MAVKLRAGPHVIRIGREFLSGRDSIRIDGVKVYGGSLENGKPYSFVAAHRRILISRSPVSSLLGVFAYQVSVWNESERVFASYFDHRGKACKGAQDARKTVAIQTCAMLGGFVGLASFVYFRSSDASLPGITVQSFIGGLFGSVLAGAIDGALLGFVGGLVGWINGRLIFRRS